jgi:hypothetical protein
MDNPETPNPNPSPREQPVQLTPSAERSGLLAPSTRVTAALAAAMLGVGVAVGAAIGPAPSSSLALGQRLPLLLPSLLAAAGVGGHPSTAAVPPPAIAAQRTPHARRARHHGRVAASIQPASENGSSSSDSTQTTPAPRANKPTGTSKTQASTLPPITHVWLIQLSGTTLESALAASTGAPYINTQAARAGTAIGGWSAIDASAFASDAALLASKPPQLVDTIAQPPCPEGATGAQCAAGTPGALSAADAFLAATIPAITATASYRTNGLIVVTFASIAAGSATGLPGASTDVTLTSQPPAGALLISPFVTAGASSSTPFTPASPTQSLERLLHP